MLKPIQIVSAFFAVVLLVVILNQNQTYEERIVYFLSAGKNASLEVKVADTGELRTTGLMFVNQMAEDKGMLFIFEDEKQHAFWMKNTLIPLDMIFVAANGTVVGVVENATPCEKDPCEAYSVNAASQYVVEANAGFARRNGISAGARVFGTG